MGTYISKCLIQKILYYDSQVYLILDADAVQGQLSLAQNLYQRGVSNIYLVNLIKKDPNSLGHEVVWDYINNKSKLYSNLTFFDSKMEDLLNFNI